MWQTTSADFELYKKECLYWLDYFSLGEWHVRFVHSESTEADGGWMLPDFDNMDAEIGLTKEIESFDQSEETIKFIAFHEISELMFYPFRRMGEMGIQMSELAITKVTHTVINKLTKSVFRDYVAKGERR